MVVKKRDFQKTAGLIQEFLSKLSCEEATAELRDAMNLVLFYLQKYYKKLRSRSLSNGASPRLNEKSLSGSLVLNGGVSPVSPACGTPDQFEWKWYNLESPRLSASLGTNEFSSLPLVLQAAKSADLKLLKELIDKDPEVVWQVDGLGRNAAMYCVHGNTPVHLECLQILITAESDLDLQANDNTTALHVAAHVNNTKALILLLHNKASHNVEDNQGRTPLHWAAASSSEDNVKLLLQVGGNLNAVDSEGLTPAMWACYFDQLQNLQFLHKALSRIDPEEDAIFRDTDRYGQCVIHWAVKGVGSLQCLEALLTPQTAILRDSDGRTVLHTAAEKGNTAACEMVLEVRGNLEGLLDTDNSKRTPVHLAAICGQGEVVNFFLDRGGDLSVKDCFGATAVDYVHNKHLNYCGMVIRAHSQCGEHHTNKNAFASTTSNKESSQDSQTETSRPQPSAVTVEAVNATREDHQHRTSFHDQNCDVSELHGFDVQGGSGQVEDEQTTQNREHHSKGGTINLNNADNRDEENTSSNTNRRQSTLTRQSGFHNESDSRHLVDQAPSFDLRTEDGNILVVVSNLDIEDQQEEIIDMEDGDIEIDCEENLEYSSVRLQQGHGSASSVHSDPDNADNCSVSVALSVSSLGSDNEEEVHDEDLMDYPDESSKQKQRRGKVMDSQAQIIPESHMSTNQPSRQLAQDLAPPPKYPQKLVQLQNNYTDNNVEYDQDNLSVPPKKKKDKTKKKKQKGPTVSEMSSPLPLPRGTVPPLNPPSLGPPGIAKLSVLDPRGIKPAPWEHGSLGPLRQAPPEPPSSIPGMGRHAEFSKGYSHHGEVLDRNQSTFERPRTPEPPRSPRDITTNQSLQPCPPSSIIGSQGTPFRGPMEVGVHDREMNYGPPGPFHGPLAHANGQALLKNMDIIGRGPKMESWPGKNVGGMMSHGPPGQQIQALHGPIPHPPQR